MRDKKIQGDSRWLLWKLALSFSFIGSFPVLIAGVWIIQDARTHIAKSTLEVTRLMTQSMDAMRESLTGITQYGINELSSTLLDINRKMPDKAREQLEGVYKSFFEASERELEGLDLSEEARRVLKGRLEKIKGDLIGLSQATYADMTSEMRAAIENNKQVVAGSILSAEEGTKAVTVAAKSEMDKAVAEASRQIWTDVGVTIALVIVFAVTLGIIMARRIANPIKALADTARRIAEGDLTLSVERRSRGELGILEAAFKEMLLYLKKIAELVEKISRGDLTGQIEPRSDRDALGKSLKEMSFYLREMAVLATNISAGHLREEVVPRSDQDGLGKAFSDVVQYLRSIALTAARIAKGDLVREVQLGSKEDVLGEALREMILGLRSLISGIRTGAQQMSEDARSQAVAVQGISDSIRQMAHNVQAIAQRTEAQSVSIEETSSSVEEMAMTAREISESVGSFSMSMEKTTESVLKIIEAIQDIEIHVNTLVMVSREAGTDAEKGTEAVMRTLEGITQIKQAVEDTARVIKRLSDKSERIGEIVNLIDGIADQTNLLALNATIIAAQAGEHGRGFAVVADEIKGLAERTMKSTREIGDLIRSIQMESGEAVKLMKMSSESVVSGVTLSMEAEQALGKILKSVQKSEGMVYQIAEATREQGKSAEHVKKAIEEIRKMLDQILRAIDEQSKGSKQIRSAVGDIRDLSHEINSSMEVQATGLSQIAASMQEINQLVQRNSEQARRLLQSVDRFILEG